MLQVGDVEDGVVERYDVDCHREILFTGAVTRRSRAPMLRRTDRLTTAAAHLPLVQASAGTRLCLEDMALAPLEDARRLAGARATA